MCFIHIITSYGILYMFLHHSEHVTFQHSLKTPKRFWQIYTDLCNKWKKKCSYTYPLTHKYKTVSTIFMPTYMNDHTYIIIHWTHGLIWIIKPMIKSSQKRNIQWILIFFVIIDHLYDAQGQSLMGPFSPCKMCGFPQPWYWE